MRALKLILGQSPWVQTAAEDWLRAEPGLTLEVLEVTMGRDHAFELPALDRFDPESFTAFVAWGPKFLNFQRLELVGELKKRGFRMPALVHPSAHVSPSATLQENVWIQAQAVVSPQARIGLNAHVGMGVRVGARGQIGNHAWLGQDVRVGTEARVEAHAVLGDAVVVAAGVRIGRYTCIEVACVIAEDCPDRSFRLQCSGLQGQIIDYGGVP